MNRCKKPFSWVGVATLVIGLGTGPMLVGAPAEENNLAKPSPAASEPEKPAASNATSSAANYSTGIGEIIKLAEAGIAPEIIKGFIDRSSIPYDPTAADIIALKQRGVPDEVTAALLKRGADVKAQLDRTRAKPAAPAIVKALSTDGHLDPDSYDFWLQHYAYPRALSYSYRTLPLAPYYNRHRYGSQRASPYRSHYSEPNRRYR